MKKLGKKLSLNKETIRELTDHELGEAVGAAYTDPPCWVPEPTTLCTRTNCPTVSNVTCLCPTNAESGCVTCGCC